MSILALRRRKHVSGEVDSSKQQHNEEPDECRVPSNRDATEIPENSSEQGGINVGNEEAA